MLFVLRVVAQKSPIAESERLPLLLAQLHSLYRPTAEDGTDGLDARLPLPDEVIDLLKAA